MITQNSTHRGFFHDNDDILVLRKDQYCILLLSVMPVDAAQKEKDEIRLIGSWDLGVLFQKILPAGHNAGRVINYSITLKIFPPNLSLIFGYQSVRIKHNIPCHIEARKLWTAHESLLLDKSLESFIKLVQRKCWHTYRTTTTIGLMSMK